ncbi:hypothetical protein PM082_012344 [Marasmius tenuissimus]|nr:hypothetical protein PM082_012344 [Marasmius tenuissimus]
MEGAVSAGRHLCYIVVGSLAVVLWDVLLHLQVDIALLRKSGLHLPQVTYAISRLTTVAFLLCETVLLTSQVGSHCSILTKAVTSLWCFHYTLIGLLQFLRIRAIYFDHNWVVRFFLLIWVVSSGTSIGISPFILDGGPDEGDPSSCRHTHLNVTLIQIAMIINTVQGTCIVFAHSSGLILSPGPNNSVAGQSGILERLKGSLSARDAPSFTKALLRHGQRYYLLLFSSNLSLITIIAIEKIPLAYRVGFVVLTHVVIHCNACSVFRNVGIAKYTPQDIILDELPISFYRDPSRRSSHVAIDVVLEGQSRVRENRTKHLDNNG